MTRGTAHAPKPDGQRRRRNQPATGEREFPRTGLTYGPTIEDATGREWPPFVTGWWNTWRRAAQAAAFEETDWQRLAMVAPLVATLAHEDCSPNEQVKMLGEIRQNEERLGATFVDRQRARIRITDPNASDTDGPGLASVTSLDAARARWAEEADEDD